MITLQYSKLLLNDNRYYYQQVDAHILAISGNKLGLLLARLFWLDFPGQVGILISPAIGGSVRVQPATGPAPKSNQTEPIAVSKESHVYISEATRRR